MLSLAYNYVSQEMLFPVFIYIKYYLAHIFLETLKVVYLMLIISIYWLMSFF